MIEVQNGPKKADRQATASVESNALVHGTIRRTGLRSKRTTLIWERRIAKTISISGERKIDPESDNVRYHRREREGGKFSRIISLPGDINAGKVEARLVNGVLELIIAKAEEAKPRQITIK